MEMRRRGRYIKGEGVSVLEFVVVVVAKNNNCEGMERRMKRGEKEKEKDGVVELGFENHIVDLPIHMLSEIMFKLPAISIVRCASVCTKFRSIVTDSSFQQSYLSRSPVSCVVLSNHQRLFCIDSGFQSEILPPNQGSSCMAMQDPPPPKRRSPNTLTDTHNRLLQLQQLQASKRKSRFVTFLTNRRMNLVNSSHGLLCLRTYATNRTRYLSHSSIALYFVCNPLLGEVLSVPPAPNAVDDDRFLFSAFGFNPKTKHYKILQLVWKSDHMVAELYRLGDKKWSVIEAPSSAKPVANNSSFDPSLNGVLHWVTDKITCSELICSFDLHMNKFKWVAPPSHLDTEYVNKMSGISVGVLKGCLCLCYVIENARFETWSMEKYDVKESWRKVFSIDIESIIGLRPQDKHRPMGFNSSGDMWLRAEDSTNFLSNSQCLLSFTAQTGVFKHIDVGVSASNIQATPQILSYVSLRDMLHLPPGTRLKLQKLSTDKNYGFGFLAM